MHSQIVRAITVIEYTHPEGNGAMLFVQDRGSASMMWEDEHRYDEFGNPYHTQAPRWSRLEIDGYGEVVIYKNADDLFSQWRGPQPGKPAGLLQPPPKEINP